MRNLIHRTLAVAALVASAAASAHANPVTYTSYSVYNDENVTLTDTSLGINSETGGSGLITLSGTNTAGGSLFTWCVDIQHYLASSGQFPTQSFLTGAFANAVNALISNAGSVITGNANASSALQIAIWEAEYGSNLTVTDSNQGATLGLANTYLGYVQNGTWKPNTSLQVLELNGGGSNQSQAFLVPVPEPSSVALLGAGLLSLGFTRRARALGRRAASGLQRLLPNEMG